MDMAAYNTAQDLTSEIYVKSLDIPDIKCDEKILLAMLNVIY